MEITLRQARRMKEYTIPFMAQKLGVSEYIYRKYENNPGKVTIEVAMKICSILDMTMEQIFFGQNFILNEHAKGV